MRLAYIGIALILLGIITPLIYIVSTSTQASYGGAVIILPIPIAIVFGNNEAATNLATILSIALLAAFIAYIVALIMIHRSANK
ncbi:MAG: hypothetical protein AT710_00245 [Thermocladium sp. ECH_B]|nr:MAG: hypothetical protein AT710_00245 [Thermocladium sp. ECH_B]